MNGVAKLRDEKIDDPDEVVLANQFLQTVRKKYRLAPINTSGHLDF
jgi:hypothetical protein